MTVYRINGKEIKQKAREEINRLLTKVACDFVNYHSDTAMVFKDLEEKLPNFIDSLLSQVIQKQRGEIIKTIEEMKGEILADLYSMPDDDDILYKSEVIKTLTTK